MSLEDINNKIELKFNNIDKNETTRWFHGHKRPLKGVFVVVHGLNLKPSKMNPIVSFLNELGFSVLRVTLDGHRGSLEDQENISLSKWLKTYHEYFCLAKNEAETKNVPLYNLSFSLGALIGLSHMSIVKKVYYKKMIFLAPAAWTKNKVLVFDYFKFLSGKFGVPSMAHQKYRSQETTSLNAYWSMSDARELTKKLTPKNLSVDTLVILDPMDEVISVSKMKSFITKKNLQNKWSLKLLNDQRISKSEFYHHLIIDETSLGKADWRKVQEFIQEFLTAKIMR